MDLNQIKAAGKAVTKVVKRCDVAKQNKKLDLSQCNLRSFPDAVFYILRDTNLFDCNLSQNIIKSIPLKFGAKFRFLVSLDLSGNNLMNLPQGLAEITQLRRLDISKNSFYTLPPVILAFKKLTHMQAHQNYIQELEEFDELHKLEHLKMVNFQSNPFSESTYKKLKEIKRFLVILSPLEETLRLYRLENL